MSDVNCSEPPRAVTERLSLATIFLVQCSYKLQLPWYISFTRFDLNGVYTLELENYAMIPQCVCIYDVCVCVFAYYVCVHKSKYKIQCKVWYCI